MEVVRKQTADIMLLQVVQVIYAITGVRSVVYQVPQGNKLGLLLDGEERVQETYPLLFVEGANVEASRRILHMNQQGLVTC